ncbi:cysteine dioxygenase family protein [Candidatus Binatia bacterium]|nr:cysteine dioxygenase family protein [Candidatus Binatia bacterium]
MRRARDALRAAEPAQSIGALLRETIAAAPPRELRRALLGVEAAERMDGTPRFGQHLLVDSPELTIFHATLPPGFVNAPHDHRTWAVVAVYEGEERNVFYERRDDALVPEASLVATAPRVVVMRDDTIHAIENRLPTPSYAIHAYGNAHFHVARSMWHPETLREEPRDEKIFAAWSRDMIARGVRLPEAGTPR